MTDESSTARDGGDPPDPRTRAALAALLAIDADTAASIRERTPSRRRRRTQYGPALDVGRALDPHPPPPQPEPQPQPQPPTPSCPPVAGG